MNEFRGIQQTVSARPTLEGAGVRLRRVFGFGETGLFDPFLLLDDFGSDDPDDYMAGFPWHPHRGIETVTYMLSGEVEHGDSLGNAGVIGPGDIQWMTAGSGIVHQEMPRRSRTGLSGFQLWVNLPAARKMTAPRYRDVAASSIPETSIGPARVKVVSGELGGVRGPVADLFVETLYFDVALPRGERAELPLAGGLRGLIYCFEGGGAVEAKAGAGALATGECVVLSDGEALCLGAGRAGLRCLLIAGRPLGEPVAWRGPIVMNTQAELELAFKEYRDGAFLKTAR